MNKNKIGFIISGLRNGGAEHVIANLANMFAEKGSQTSVITFTRGNDEYSLDNKIHRYVLEEPLLNSNSLIAKFQRYIRLRRIIKERDLDVLVAFIGGAITYGILSTIGLKTKCIISIRNAPDFLYPGTINRLFNRCFLSMADGAVFQTKEAQDWFPKRLKHRSTIILNPLHSNFFEQKYIPNELEVVTFGRLIPQKNQCMLIMAFKKVVECYPDVKLSIYGEGPLSEELVKLIIALGLEKNVYIKGRTTDVDRILSKSTLFVLSSDVEGVPNALMEAMAVGVPCISTDCPCGGPKMLLGNNERGMLVPIGNSEKMADAIITMLSDKNLRSLYSNKTIEYASQFQEEKIISVWEQYIKKILR